MRWNSIAATLATCASLVAAMPVGVAATPLKSLYTTLAPDACRIVKRHEHGNAWSCPGLDGWPVYLAEGDGRTFVSYGRDGARHRAAEQTLGAFNSPFTGKARRATVEWRFVRRDGKPIPFATILRLRTDVDGRRGDVLVVTKVAAGESCHVAYIDALANAEPVALARKTADELARTFDCRNEPQVIGKRGRSPL